MSGCYESSVWGMKGADFSGRKYFFASKCTETTKILFSFWRNCESIAVRECFNSVVIYGTINCNLAAAFLRAGERFS